MRKNLLTSMSALAIASATLLALTACSSSGWGQRGSQKSGDTHTLTGGAEASPTSESTPQPAGTSSGTSSGTAAGTSSPTQEGMPAGGMGTPGGSPPEGTSGGANSGMPGSASGATPEGTSGGGAGNQGTQPEQPVPPKENMGSSVR